MELGRGGEEPPQIGDAQLSRALVAVRLHGDRP
jgi:hypothetical protein